MGGEQEGRGRKFKEASYGDFPRCSGRMDCECPSSLQVRHSVGFSYGVMSLTERELEMSMRSEKKLLFRQFAVDA